MASYNGDGDVQPLSHVPYVTDPSASLGRPAGSVTVSRGDPRDHGPTVEYKGHTDYTGSVLSFGHGLLPRRPDPSGRVEYVPHTEFPLVIDPVEDAEFDAYHAKDTEIIERNNAGGVTLADRLRRGQNVLLRWPILRHDPIQNFVSLRFHASVDARNIGELLNTMSQQGRGRQSIKVPIPFSVIKRQFASMGEVRDGYHMMPHTIYMDGCCTRGWIYGPMRAQFCTKIPGTNRYRDWCMTNTCTRTDAHCGPVLFPDTSCPNLHRQVYTGDVVKSQQTAFRNWLSVDLNEALGKLDKTVDNDVYTFRLTSNSATNPPNEIVHMITEHWHTVKQLAVKCIQDGQCPALESVPLVRETDNGEVIVCLPVQTVRAIYQEHKANMNKEHLLMSLNDVVVKFQAVSDSAWRAAREHCAELSKLGPALKKGPPLNISCEFVIEGSIVRHGKNPYAE